ncbi:MAG: hypothetical protein JW843_04505 [Candidatus Aminicenantes bacterium]|nr:hypothetical protein [Candidatus Aminicenantes bacterium]
MNAPYWPVPIAIFLALLYGLSLLLVRLDILGRATHRKIWNWALLLTFTIAAGLGLLLAVQVNSRLRIPWADQALRVHVNFGLAMAAIGAVHLAGRISHFFRRSGPKASSAGTGVPPSASVEPLPRTSAAFLLPAGIGFSGVVVQALLIRDFLTLFEGNELTVSLVLFLWLLVTGAGSLAGSGAGCCRSIYDGNHADKAKTAIHSLFFIPLVLFPLIFVGKSLLFSPGVEAGPLAMSGFLAFILVPFCFLNGFSFTFSARVLKREGRSLGTVYGWESAGGAAGGLFVTGMVLTGLPSLTILGLAGSFFFILTALLRGKRRLIRWVLPAAFLAAAAFVQVFDVDRLIVQRFHPNEEIAGTASGSSGRLTVTRTAGQVNVYENGILVHAAGNTIAEEELAAFALVQTGRPDSVLIIGGLLTGLAGEASKYGSGRIDVMEPDPGLFRLAGTLGLAEESASVRLIRKTPAAWLRAADTRYGAVLINLPGPLSLNLNRFYTADFFRRVRGVLEPDGIVAAVLPGTANYVSENAAATLGPVIRAALEAFREALVFPGENSYLLMSDRPLTTDILTGLQERGVQNLYVNPDYFDATLFRDRVERLNREIGPAAVPNSDLKPAAFLAQIRWWLGRFPEDILWPGAILLTILLLLGIFTGNSRLAGMFLLGAASSGWSVTLLLLLQITAGAIYQWTGLLLGTFMVGLAAGSAIGPRLLRADSLKSEALPLGGFILVSVLAGVFSPGLAYGRGPVGIKLPVLFALGFIVAAAVGACFAVWAVKLDRGPGKSDRLYGYDLLGSAAGAVGFPMVALPLAGFQNGLYLLAAAGAAALLMTVIGGRKRRNVRP